MQFTQNQLAFKCNSLPCNPLPFLTELLAGCKENSGFINTLPGHMLIHILNQMAHGQLYTLDSFDEFCRLNNYVEKNQEQIQKPA